MSENERRQSCSYESKKMELDHGRYFIEYFYSIGVDHINLLDETLYSSILDETDINKIKENLNENEKIKPSIITKYPPVNKKNYSIDEELIIQVRND